MGQSAAAGPARLLKAIPYSPSRSLETPRWCHSLRWTGFCRLRPPSRASFTHALLDSLTEGLRAEITRSSFRTCTSQQFDPAMTAAELYDGCPPPAIVAEQARVSWAELIILVYPVWWWGSGDHERMARTRPVSWLRVPVLNITRRGYAGLLAPRQAAVISVASADPYLPTAVASRGSGEARPRHPRYRWGPTAPSAHPDRDHEYAPPEAFTDAIQAVEAFARTL